MDPVGRKNLDVQHDPHQPNPVAPTAVAARAGERAEQALRSVGLEPARALEPTAIASVAQLERAAPLLKQAGFLLFDVVGVDYLKFVEETPKRLAVVYNLYNIETNTRVFVKVFVDDGEPLPSLYPIWKSANYLEREVYDLIGVPFTGHPDLRKILTPDDLEGHALRKDFPLGESPTQFRDGRFIDPPSFRAGLTGQSGGLTGWRGGERRGLAERPEVPPVTGAPEIGGQS